MENIFNHLSDKLIATMKKDEHLIISFDGENSQFIRFNNASIRQTGLVDDATMGLKYIANGRTCYGAFTVSGDQNTDIQRGKYEIDRMRLESKEIPVDPFLVLPKNAGSSHEVKKVNGLPFDNAVNSLIPVMEGIDFVGIWVNGKMYRGNANSAGQRHWFETDSHCLDYSLVTPSHQMVKGCYAGSDWNQENYEKYVENSKSKLKIMNRKPVKVNTCLLYTSPSPRD